MNKEKKIIYIYIGFVALVFVSAHFFSYNEMKLTRIQFDSAYSSNENICWCIESADKKRDINGEKVTIQGWCFEKGLSAYDFEVYFALENIKSKNIYQLPTAVYERQDVDALYDDEYSYSSCGIKYSGSLKKLDLSNNSYQLYVIYKNENGNHLIKTDTIIGDY